MQMTISILQGPNGLYDPSIGSGSFVQNPDTCVMAGDPDHPYCSKIHPQSLCQYYLEYQDGLHTKGVLVEDSLTLTLTNNEIMETTFTFG